MELGLVVPILLLLFAGAADLGRAFYAYVALENAVKEGALYGANHPVCDDNSASGCTAPNNVRWHVQNELNGLKDINGAVPVPAVQCLSAINGIAWANLNDCKEGDTYVVTLSLPFRLITPILGNVLPNPMTITSASRAIVFNGAIDATPPGGGGTTGGVSVQKYINPANALNTSDITTKCLEPDDSDANGFYRSPCLDSSTPLIPDDKITARFDTGTSIGYRVVVSNSGAVALTNITIQDCAAYEGTTCTASWPSVSANCPARPSTLAVGSAAYICTYTTTAPGISDSSAIKNYVNNITVDATEISPAVSAVTAQFEKPAAFSVVKLAGAYPLGNDGDGVPIFGVTAPAKLTVGYTASSAAPVVWFYIGVTNTGAKTATGVTITDSTQALPFGQNNATAVCDVNPGTMTPGQVFTCRYAVTLPKTANNNRSNIARARASNVVIDANDDATAIVAIAQCGNNEAPIPNVVGMTKANAQAAWNAAGFTAGNLTFWANFNADLVVTQNRQAGSCEKTNNSTSMTVTRVITP